MPPDDRDRWIEQRFEGVERGQQQTLDAIRELRQEIREGYVTADRFDPVQKIVYGLVAAVLLAALGLVMTLARGGAP